MLFAFESFQIIFIWQTFIQYHFCPFFRFFLIDVLGNFNVVVALFEVRLVVHNSDFFFRRNKFILLFLPYSWHIIFIQLNTKLLIMLLFWRFWSWFWFWRTMITFFVLIIIKSQAIILVHVLLIFKLFWRRWSNLGIVKILGSTINLLTRSKSTWLV